MSDDWEAMLVNELRFSDDAEVEEDHFGREGSSDPSHDIIAFIRFSATLSARSAILWSSPRLRLRPCGMNFMLGAAGALGLRAAF